MVFRRIFGLLALVIAAALLVSGCAGGRTPAAQPTAPAAPAATTAPAAGQLTAPTAAPAVGSATTAPAAAAPSGEPIKIGIVSPFSGPLGILGQWMDISAKAEVERINKEGGLLGRPVELLTRDDELNPQKSVEAVRELIDKEKVDLLVGPSLTAFAVAVKDFVTQSKTIQMLPTVAGLAATTDAPYAFRTLESARLQMTEVARLAKKLNLKKVGIIYLDDAAGKEYIQYLPEGLAANGVEYAGQEAFRADDQDLTTQVLKMKELGVDGVVIGSGNSAQCAKVIAAVGKLGWNVQILGNSGLENTQLATLVGEPMVGAKFVNTFRGYQGMLPADQMPTGYARHLKAVLGSETIPPPESRDLSKFGINTPTADAIFIWAEAVKRAGSVDSEKVKAELEKTNVPADQSPSGGNLVISADNREAYREGSLYFYEWKKLPNGTIGYTSMDK